MGYIAINEVTNEAVFSKGANKIAHFLEINPTTVARATKKGASKKLYKGYRLMKCKELNNKNRGSDIKSSV